MINRSQLRGRPLDADCKRAYTERSEDDRVYCLGLIDLANDEYLDKCKTCMANVYNAEPLEEVTP